MKRAMFCLLSVVLLIGLVGCIHQHGRRPWACMGGSCAQAPENCQECTESGDACTEPCRGCFGKGCKLCGGREVVAQPAMGATAYPYYTTRGPRDFLAKNPPSIGP